MQQREQQGQQQQQRRWWRHHKVGAPGRHRCWPSSLRAVLLTVGLAAAPAAAPRSVILERALKRLEWERVQEKEAKEKVGERVAAGL